jgi:hypothetical protein
MSHVVKLCAILALRAQAVDIAGLALRQDVFAKSASMNASKGFLFGQQPEKGFPLPASSCACLDFPIDKSHASDYIRRNIGVQNSLILVD